MGGPGTAVRASGRDSGDVGGRSFGGDDDGLVDVERAVSGEKSVERGRNAASLEEANGGH